jgi:myo-inositol-1(or 4)-monophosphatase
MTVNMLTTADMAVSDQYEVVLQRIFDTLICVTEQIASRELLGMEVTHAENGDPTTALDHKINNIIRDALPQQGEGWLSEENHDDLQRLSHSRVWIVDPIDGTREFLNGIPEWAVSIGLAVDQEAVAGGVLNPCTGEIFIGSITGGIKVIQTGSHSNDQSIRSASVSVSRREYRQGKWHSLETSGLPVKPVGSIAYRLARVAAGLDLATVTFETRSEWDVAAGVALMYASGGRVDSGLGKRIRFNNEAPRLNSLFAFGKDCSPKILRLLGRECHDV